MLNRMEIPARRDGAGGLGGRHTHSSAMIIFHSCCLHRSPFATFSREIGQRLEGMLASWKRVCVCVCFPLATATRSGDTTAFGRCFESSPQCAHNICCTFCSAESCLCFSGFLARKVEHFQQRNLFECIKLNIFAVHQLIHNATSTFCTLSRVRMNVWTLCVSIPP